MDFLTSSLAQVQLDPSPGGPITRLPNELVRTFLVKLEMLELIRLRLVCPRWKAVIESIAQSKKSLILSCGAFYDFDIKDVRNVFAMTKRFFGQIDLKRDFMLIQLKAIALSQANTRNLALFLVVLFPSVQQLVIQSSFLYNFDSVLMLWPEQIHTLSFSFQYCDVTPFAKWINSLTSLKRLDLNGGFRLLLKYISPKIYANLEHFSHHPIGEGPSRSVRQKVLGQLGSNCTRLSLSDSAHEAHGSNVPNWLKADSIRNLTHLDLPFFHNYYQLWEVVCDRFTSLQTLYIRKTFDVPAKLLSSGLLNIVSRLPNLTELQLFRLNIEDELEPEPKFAPLVNVRTFAVYVNRDCFPQLSTFLSDRERFTQFIVNNLLLPNIQQLTIEEL